MPRLLAESRAHHLNKTRFANRLNGKQHIPNYPAAEEEIALALQKRLAAHDLDPDHTSPAWKLDTSPHASLVGFFTVYPTIP